MLGKLLLIAGLCLAFYAFTMDTSVKVDYGEFNNEEFGLNLPKRVNNLGLMQEKNNYTIFSGVMILAGVILIAIDKSKKKATIQELEKIEE